MVVWHTQHHHTVPMITAILISYWCSLYVVPRGLSERYCFVLLCESELFSGPFTSGFMASHPQQAVAIMTRTLSHPYFSNQPISLFFAGAVPTAI